MNDRDLKILSYLVQDIKSEIACWDQSIECFGNNTTNETLLEKIRILECKANEHRKLVENIEIFLSQ